MKIVAFVVFEKSDEKVYLSVKKKYVSLFGNGIQNCNSFRTISVSYLILHQKFYLIKVYHVRAKFNSQEN